jgi:hypothetical protein
VLEADEAAVAKIGDVRCALVDGGAVLVAARVPGGAVLRIRVGGISERDDDGALTGPCYAGRLEADANGEEAQRCLGVVAGNRESRSRPRASYRERSSGLPPSPADPC